MFTPDLWSEEKIAGGEKHKNTFQGPKTWDLSDTVNVMLLYLSGGEASVREIHSFETRLYVVYK